MTYQLKKQNQVSEYIYQTSIEDLFFIKHKNFKDERGFYSEIARVPEIEKILNIKFNIKQINHSRSKTNVLRGFHAESWYKLITLASGKVFAVIADIRPESKTFLKSEKFVLGFDQDSLQGALFVSSGLANGFAVLQGPADYFYAVDALYEDRDKSQDQAISLFDPDLSINWPVKKSEQIYSNRDKNSINLRKLYPNRF